VRGLSKAFGARTVLSSLDIHVAAGEVHALLGQNGSGKSTFIKILTGYHAPEPGAEAEIFGVPAPLPFHGGEARHLGLAFVHQDLGLAPDLTVLENVCLGRYRTGPGHRIRWRAERQRVRASLERFGVDVDPEARVRDLPEADRAIVAIVRATDGLEEVERGILVLDEPTVYLPRDAVEQLFHTVRQTAAAGHAVMLVTHRLEEVFAIADRATVLRDGRSVATVDVAQTTERELVAHILGRSIDALFPQAAKPAEDCVLRARGVGGRTIGALDFDLRRGEVLGVSGLVGMGLEELPYLLFGAQDARGTLELDGAHLQLSSMTPRRAIDAGLVLLPADRLERGGVERASLTENLTLATLGTWFEGGRLRHGKEQSRSTELLSRFQVSPPLPDLPFAMLSGGNQQKVLLAKWFEADPRAFVMHEPTQGVDVGARQQIFREIREAAARGVGFIVASVEYGELANLCDRVIVLRDGQGVGELSGDDLTGDRIVECCYVGRAAGSDNGGRK
jgi:ribose transport system ATP-binding protein